MIINVVMEMSLIYFATSAFITNKVKNSNGLNKYTNNEFSNLILPRKVFKNSNLEKDILMKHNNDNEFTNPRKKFENNLFRQNGQIVITKLGQNLHKNDRGFGQLNNGVLEFQRPSHIVYELPPFVKPRITFINSPDDKIPDTKMMRKMSKLNNINPVIKFAKQKSNSKTEIKLGNSKSNYLKENNDLKSSKKLSRTERSMQEHWWLSQDSKIYILFGSAILTGLLSCTIVFILIKLSKINYISNVSNRYVSTSNVSQASSNTIGRIEEIVILKDHKIKELLSATKKSGLHKDPDPNSVLNKNSLNSAPFKLKDLHRKNFAMVYENLSDRNTFYNHNYVVRGSDCSDKSNALLNEKRSCTPNTVESVGRKRDSKADLSISDILRQASSLGDQNMKSNFDYSLSSLRTIKNKSNKSSNTSRNNSSE